MSGGVSVFAATFGAGLRRLWRQCQEGGSPPGFGTQSRPVADPGHQAALTIHSFEQRAQLALGVITDATAVANCYRVQVENLHYPVTAVYSSLGAAGAFGARSLGTLPVGTQVWVIWHPHLYYGSILSVVPGAQTAGNKHIASHIALATRNRVDEGHLHPLRMPSGGFITDWLAGRPFDATCAGEQGWITETGMRVFLDSWMAQIGLDEGCSLTTFYHDQLLRLAAYNLRMFSAGMEREALDDQGEYNDWTGYTPYPWEQLGLFERGDPRQEFDPQAWQIDEPHYGHWEPKEAKQRSWHREIEFHGYLGQGGKRIVQAPPLDAGEAALFDPGGTTQYPTLADATTALTGRMSFCSAKGISITKRLQLPGPTRNYPPEQINNEGDSLENYKAAGIAGSGPSHTIKDDLKTKGRAELNRVGGLCDLHAYWFNYACNHAFFYHNNDWFLPEENELAHGAPQPVSIYSALAGSMFLEAPDPVPIKIDHRYNEVDYYPNQSGIELLEDGGVVIYDGFGASITMTAGHIYFDAPGDIWTKAGRSAVTWGGDDIVLRAKNSLDATCTEKDIRLKAEANLHMLAGNSEEKGGVLIESRAPSRYEFEDKQGEEVASGGVMIRAPKGEIATWSQRVYLRTGGGDIEGGDITLDADQGARSIVTHAKEQRHYLDNRGGGFFLHFGREETIDRTTYFSADGAGVGTSLCAAGRLTVAGSGLFKGQLQVAQGHIATEGAQGDPDVTPLSGVSLEEVYAAVDSCQQDVVKTRPQAAKTTYGADLADPYYQDKKAGHDKVIRAAEFSLRSVSEYGADGFELYASRWQQLADASGGGGSTWEEKPVPCQVEPETYPYPGKENYKEPTFKMQAFSLFDAAVGASKPRGSQPNLQAPYLDPGYEEPKTLKLDAYPVIR